MAKAATKTLVLLCALLLPPLLWGAEPRPPDGLSASIERGFRQFMEESGMYFEKDLETELQREYREGLLGLSPEKFANPEKARQAISRYGRPEGVREILADWVRQTEGEWDEMMSVDALLTMKVFMESSPETLAYFGPNMANKYATLIVEAFPAEVTADIILDGRFIADTREAPDGVLVASGRKYRLEVKAAGFRPLREDVMLEKRERRKVRYDAKK